LSDTTERLIRSLVRDARPVARLRPPPLRAALWLTAVGALLALAIFFFADLQVFARRAQSARLDGEMAGMLLTGILAVLAAFELSLPDRSPAWALLPLPPLALWLALIGYACYGHWSGDGWAPGSSAACFKFILGAGLPLGGSLLFLLRRAAPLAPVRIALAGGLGAAGIAAFALQFFHPFDVTFLDLVTQVFAAGLVVLAAGGWERLALAREAKTHFQPFGRS
jgi:hypothetical protein